MTHSPLPDGLTRDAILSAIKAQGGRLGKREIAKALSIRGDDRIALKRLLKDMEDEGSLTRTAGRDYALPNELPSVTVVQVIDRDVDGELLCQPLKGEGEYPTIRLAPGEGAGGKNERAVGIGDKLLVRLSPEDDGQYEARIIKKLGGSAHKILCVMRKNENGSGRLIPVDRRTKYELIPVKGESAKANDGDLVMCRLSSEKRYGLKTAIIEEVIGDANSPRAGSIIALAEHGVPTGFGAAELEYVKNIAPVGMEGREDLRDIPLITIDPADARDHDDAVWAGPDEDPTNKDGWVVLVAIADVAAYVIGDSPLDQGARARGVSVYLPDRVVPMLPERLSNDLCSLREMEERPCLAVRMVFDRNGNKKSHRFIRGWMRSAAKLAYEEAQAAIDGQGTGKAETLKKDVLEPLWAAYRVLKDARDRRDPLNIDAPERKVRVNEAGEVTGIERRERLEAHMLIEEMMIQANVAAAEALEEKKSPLIYRVHDEPGSEKIDSLADFLPTVNLKWTKAERPTTQRFNKVLDMARGSDHWETVNEVVLRSQSQAVYDVRNIGHFGLNLTKYAHFTSPIRRYADLTVHRGLIRAYKLGPNGQSDSEQVQLERIAEDTTANERRAMAAERDAVDRFIANWLSGRVGGEFEGRITGVTRFGAFVRLHETGADGLCPVSQLGNEYFRHDERAHALVGEGSGNTYRLGMSVKVRLLEATPLTGGLLFEILTPPEAGKKPPHRSHRRDSARREDRSSRSRLRRRKK
ncbi:ribonuclease R [Woodsholea maritima]|uniref:ribonuclease R n=1 Tax=Woodsholea maritima TaxID=240237 RepID=UPI000377AC42|nr:ribonuclease R [Woodsholea maritima]